MTSRLIAIGDIHGSHIAFAGLLNAIDVRRDDTIVVLGDCVDRGPGSRSVIDTLLQLRERCNLVTLLGNHEEMMLDHLAGREPRCAWLPFGGRETLASYEAVGISERISTEHLDFVRTWRDCYEHDHHFFVHGGYDFRAPLTEQDWPKWRWHSLRHHVPAPHMSGKIAVVGHTSLKDARILDLGHVICIDTYCYGGGWLTALDVNSGEYWQVNREGERKIGTHIPVQPLTSLQERIAC